MRLLRLSLQNWRGVDVRDVQFATGVTLIEGPNEVGKSTIVEALRMLFNELDSSNKKNVKAIQPVGQDVGSRVEAEVQAGDCHFVYGKTYNKSRATTLDILAPAKRQLTGREAHEAVVQMLAQSVDMALWDALLVDQGEKVAPANLQASSSLAQALDEAAGATTTGGEDTNLINAVQAEYEKYFTLKTARPRFVKYEEDVETARAALADSQAALDAVEEDSNAHARSAVEVRRLKVLLPQLQEKILEYEKAWQLVDSLQDEVIAKNKEIVHAQANQRIALDAHIQRQDAVAELEINQQQMQVKSNAQAPLHEQTEILKARVTRTQQSIVELKQQHNSAQRALGVAEGDDGYAHEREAIVRENARLKRLDEISGHMRSHLAVIAAISVDDVALASFREADNRLAIALGTRDAASTSVSVTARKDLLIEFDDAPLTLQQGATQSRAIASPVTLRLPGLADIDIVPPQSVAQLQERTQQAEEALAALAARHGVKDFEAAVAAHQQRADAQRELDRLKDREEDTLQQSSRAEIAAAVTALQAQCDRYLRQRTSGADMPATTAESKKRVNEARAVLARCQDLLDAALEQTQSQQSELDQQDSRLRQAQQELAALQSAIDVKNERLQKERAQNPDDALAERAARESAKVETLQVEANALQARLSAASPEAAQALLSNAKEVSERAAKDLQQAEQALAVLSDRLQHAQADGRFEAFEAAERNLQAASDALESIRRRGDSAALLWTSLNKHRNAAREAYVRPLKEAIDRLGCIVFGPGFEIVIGDDWSLIARTLHGKTLPFSDLSVGAKEQLSILARLAAAQIVSRQGGVPLIIDDALGFADPFRLETMGAAIAAAGKQCQIIILTCTPGRFTNVGSAQVVRF